jgi:hypothetical protein
MSDYFAPKFPRYSSPGLAYRLLPVQYLVGYLVPAVMTLPTYCTVSMIDADDVARVFFSSQVLSPLSWFCQFIAVRK